MVKFAWGRYKLFLCLVSKLWFSLFVEKIFLFQTTNINKDNIYCNVKCKICNFLNKFLHGTLFPHVCIYRVQNVFLRCPTPRLHCFLSTHRPSFRFLSFMAFFIPSIQFFFGLPRVLLCFGILFNAIFGSLSSAILWTWPYHVSWFCSLSFIIVSSSPICCLIVTFLILLFLDILEDLLRTSISVDSTRLLLFSVSLHVSAPYNKLSINYEYISQTRAEMQLLRKKIHFIRLYKISAAVTTLGMQGSWEMYISDVNCYR